MYADYISFITGTLSSTKATREDGYIIQDLVSKLIRFNGRTFEYHCDKEIFTLTFHLWDQLAEYLTMFSYFGYLGANYFKHLNA